MNLDLTKEQEVLRSLARDFLAKECPMSLAHVRDDDRGLWDKIGHLGWTGLIVPKQYGGMGATLLDLAIVLEEMGRRSYTGPFFTSAVESAMFISDLGTERQKAELLPDLAAGNKIFSLALTEPSARYGPEGLSATAWRRGNGYVINGVKLFVLYANAADYVVCLARRTDKEVIALVVNKSDPGVRIQELMSTTGDSTCEVVFDNVKVQATQALGDRGIEQHKFDGLLENLAVAKCAEMLGGAQQVLDATAKYCKHRIQFEHHIGSFQAVQHHLANMLIAVDGCRLLTYKAAWLISKGLPCTRLVSIAKSWTNDAYGRVTTLGQQLQGGPAFIGKHDMPLFYRKAVASQAMYGGNDFHRAVIAREILGC